MPLAFTADRVGSLKAGQTLALHKLLAPQALKLPGVTEHEVTYSLAPGHQARQRLSVEALQRIDAGYPDGFSRHGLRHALAPVGPNDNYYIEAAFEALRRARFPDAPSRFQSAFACATIQEAWGFATSFGGATDAACPTYEVEYAEGLRADMNLLSLKAPATELTIRAERYWTGQPGSDPPRWEIIMRLPVRVLRQVS
jgi:hypothetical protein